MNSREALVSNATRESALRPPVPIGTSSTAYTASEPIPEKYHSRAVEPPVGTGEGILAFLGSNTPNTMPNVPGAALSDYQYLLLGDDVWPIVFAHTSSQYLPLKQVVTFQLSGLNVGTAPVSDSAGRKPADDVEQDAPNGINQQLALRRSAELREEIRARRGNLFSGDRSDVDAEFLSYVEDRLSGRSVGKRSS